MTNQKVAYERGVATYLTGFALSLVLTGTAFMLASKAEHGDFLTRGTVIGFLAVLASLQVLIQVIYFLHMSTERKARWTLLSGLFATMVVLILVVGSIWVMDNLNYNMMPHNPTEYIQEKENLHKD